MNDIRPPRRPPVRPIMSQPVQLVPEQVRVESSPALPQPLPEKRASVQAPKKRRWLKRLLFGAIGAILVAVVVSVAGFLWYQKALTPVSMDTNANRTQLKIELGTTPSQIGKILFDKDLIRSTTAFDIYTRLSGTQNKLQAGSYRLSPAESTEEIVEHLVSGNVDEFSLTFYPGATLTDSRDIDESEKVDVTTVLKRAGYEEDEIKRALNRSYDHALFADKPMSSDLEGYVYGETYSFSTSASVEDILERTFDEFYGKIQQNNIISGLQSKNFNLYQGITLASIIQREEKELENQRKITGVFINRLKIDMPLGSDPTYQYAARKLGVSAVPTLDSPYNTRIYKGLPPGPIAAPNITALQAIINPVDHDYLYFLSGDDNKLYFARTDGEHEQNIRNHCQIKCFSY